MTLILSLETSTTTCGISLLEEQNGVISVTTRLHEGTSGHAMRVLPLANALLAEKGFSKNDLDAVAFGQGPGAFTGLRVACGVSQGIGMALDIPLIPVGCLSALAAMAGAARSGQLILAALDARMDEIYLAAYVTDPSRGQVILQPPVLLAGVDAMPFVLGRLKYWLREQACEQKLPPCLVGEGWRVALATQGMPAAWTVEHETARPEAAWIARLAWSAWQRGETISPEHAAPLYLRDKVAFTTAERAQGQGGNPRAQLCQDVALLPMSLADVSQVLEIERKVQQHPWTDKNFEDALAAGYEAWVLLSEQGLLGFCIGMMAPDVAHILVIAVSPEHQRLGLGNVLLAQIEQSATQRGLEGLLLEVRPSNEKALAFYKAHGFVPIGLRRDYYPADAGLREDAQVMKKTFGDA